MQPDPQDRLSASSGSAGLPKAVWIAGAVVVAIGAWYFTSGDAEPPEPEPVEVAKQMPAKLPEPEPEPEMPPAPDIPEPPAPQPPPAASTPVEEPAPEPPLPALTLENSDAELRAQLATSGDSALLSSLLANDDLMQRGAGIADSFSRGMVVPKMFNVKPPQGKFPVSGEAEQQYMDPAGYRRYDDYARAIEELDTAALVASFHRFRPLLEQAFSGMGYSGEDLDNAVIRGLDRILATPLLDEPVAVERKEAVYLFSDPSLEQRNQLQKQLLRMGPENTARIQNQARALRAGLLGE